MPYCVGFPGLIARSEAVHTPHVRPHLIFLLPLVLLSAAEAAPEGVRQIEIVHTGCHHGHEIPEGVDGEWVGLYLRAGTFEMASHAVRVVACHDPILDAPGRETGRAVVVDTEETPLFLVRGLGQAAAKPGAALTAWPERRRGLRPPGNGGSRYLRPGQRLRLTLGHEEYELTAQGRYDPTRPASDRLVLDYRLRLTGSDGRSQDLQAPARFAEDGVPLLVWAGDLDRDGKLDLYMDMTNHYNVSDYVLLLSSRATKGQLVKRVASRRYVGC